jgi:uncharacterized OsmC-like protein
MGVEQDVLATERLQNISVRSRWHGKYRSSVHIRDLPALSFDEPRELGGENSGPTALESILSALISCSAMIVYILQREKDFKLDGLEFSAVGTHDVRRVAMRATGKKYSEIEPIAKHFHAVRVEARVATKESDQRLRELAADVERLCPVINLLRDAGVPLEIDWQRA